MKIDSLAVQENWRVTDFNLDAIPIARTNPADQYNRYFDSIRQAKIATSSKEDKYKVIFPDEFIRDRDIRIHETELQWWFGKIDEISNDQFKATVQDLSGKISNVTFDRKTIAPSDANLLFVGNTFTYSVSRVDKSNGQRIHETRFSLSSKRTWLKEYENKASVLLNEVFPDSLLDL